MYTRTFLMIFLLALKEKRIIHQYTNFVVASHQVRPRSGTAFHLKLGTGQEICGRVIVVRKDTNLDNLGIIK